MAGLKVALLANLKKNAPHFEGMADDHWDDLDSETTVQALQAAIQAGGHECVFYEGDAGLYTKLTDNRPDICFNICEGHFGDGREAQVPALLEMLRLPYTGSRVLTLALALDKPMTKRVLMWHDLPTPPMQTFESPDEDLDDDMVFPLFVKPAREGTGMGVSAKYIVRTEAELREQLTFIIQRYKQRWWSATLSAVRSPLGWWATSRASPPGAYLPAVTTHTSATIPRLGWRRSRPAAWRSCRPWKWI
jgi:D-alanine-D-alanine ligase